MVVIGNKRMRNLGGHSILATSPCKLPQGINLVYKPLWCPIVKFLAACFVFRGPGVDPGPLQPFGYFKCALSPYDITC